MTFRSLPPFERGASIQLPNCFQDRLSIELGDWFFIGDEADLEVGINALRQVSCEELGGEGSIDTPLFNSRQGSYTRFEYKIPSTRGINSGAPLFAGTLKFRKISGTDFEPSLYVINFQLTLNPTRALNHQPLHPEIRASQNATHYPDIQLAQRNVALRTPHEIVLDQNDNIVLERRQRLMFNPPHWREYRNRYIETVVGFLTATLSRTLGRSDGASILRHEPRFNLKEVENYWEFRSDDPIRLVNDMVPHFYSLGTSSRMRVYENVLLEHENRDHSPVLSCQLVTGVSAKVYAKTSKRIRVEVTHDFRKSARVASSHEFRELNEVFAHLDATSVHDAIEASTLLETIENALPTDEPQLPAYDLVRRILIAAPEPRIHEPLLSIIINTNGLRLRAGDEFYRAAQQLVIAGVLIRSRPYSGSFRLAERYQTARTSLLTAS